MSNPVVTEILSFLPFHEVHHLLDLPPDFLTLSQCLHRHRSLTTSLRYIPTFLCYRGYDLEVAARREHWNHYEFQTIVLLVYEIQCPLDLRLRLFQIYLQRFNTCDLHFHMVNHETMSTTGFKFFEWMRCFYSRYRRNPPHEFSKLVTILPGCYFRCLEYHSLDLQGMLSMFSPTECTQLHQGIAATQYGCGSFFIQNSFRDVYEAFSQYECFGWIPTHQ